MVGVLSQATPPAPKVPRPALSDYAGPSEPGFPPFTGASDESYDPYRAAKLEAATRWVEQLLKAFPHFAQMRATDLYDSAIRALAMEIYREPNPYEAALVSKALQLVIGRPMAVVEG